MNITLQMEISHTRVKLIDMSMYGDKRKVGLGVGESDPPALLPFLMENY